MPLRMVKVTIPLTALVMCVPFPSPDNVKKNFIYCVQFFCDEDQDFQICWPSLLYRGYAVSRVIYPKIYLETLAAI